MGQLVVLRIVAIVAILIGAAGWNFWFAPNPMTPRAPIFNGPDIASNSEWRAMGIEMHGWWLWSELPDASVHNVGFVAPRDDSEALPVGIVFSNWIDRQLGLRTFTDKPPLDVSELNIRDQLLDEAKNYGRIDCRDSQEMARKDTCYFFVSWNWDLLPQRWPRFYAVRTIVSDSSEYALVEQRLLESLSGKTVAEIPTIHDQDRDR